jgi:nucleotide-binding universal stress UspA family protein
VVHVPEIPNRTFPGKVTRIANALQPGSRTLLTGRSRMYQKILLAFDGSPDASEALAQAKSLASMSGATVRLLAIIDPSENMLVVEGMSFVPDNRPFVTQSVFDAGVRRLRGAGCTVTNDVRYGNPAEQIVLSAKEMNADLIVVGHRDQGTLAGWLNGSVGASILHHPPCSGPVAVKSEQQKNNVTPIRKTQAQGKG